MSVSLGQKRRWSLYKYSPNAWAMEHVIGRAEPYLIGTTGRQVGKCLSYSTLVHMADGTRKRAEEVSKGMFVVSWNGRELVPAEVDAVFDNGVHPIYKITTRRGKEICVTGNHPILARKTKPAVHLYRRGHNYLTPFLWINAESIEINDEIASLPVYTVSDRENTSEYDAWVVGIITGDGGCTGTSIQISNADLAIIAGLREGNEVTAYTAQYSYGLRNGVKKYGVPYSLMGKGAYDKVVPDKILRGGRPAWCGFLAGMLDTDGTVDRLVEWYSVSKRLLSDMQMMLAYLGIQSTLSEKNGRYKGEQHKSWRLTVSGSDNILLLATELNLRGVKRNRLEKLAATKLALIPNRRGERDFVKSIDILPMEPTIGFTIAGFHTHVTDNMITHNSEELAMWIDQGMNADPNPLDRTGNPIPDVGILGPTYEKAEISVNRYIERLTRTFGADAYHLNQNKHELTIRDPLAGKPGAKLKWLSGDDAQNVVGFTFSRFGVDEAQAISDDVWFKFIPTQGVRYASGAIFGTPDIVVFQTWFQGLWQRGQDPLDTQYHSYSVATWDAPWMPIDKILEAKDQLPDSVFRRLYGGEWVEEHGLVFTNLQGAILASAPEYDANRKYVMAVDCAATEDFNVVIIGDPATRQAIYMERWNKTDPLVTYDRMESIWERFGRPKVYPDTSGFGGKLFASELKKRGMYVIDTDFTASTKMDLVNQLASDIQHRRIMFPAWEDLMREFKSFIYTRTPSGKISASATTNGHDDLVMTMVILNYAFNRTGQRGTFRGNYLTGTNELESLMYNA